VPKAQLASWEVSDAFWQRVEPLVPPRPARPSDREYLRKPGGGGKSIEARTAFEAIVYVRSLSLPLADVARSGRFLQRERDREWLGTD
jgi:hypothetical protein